MERKKLQTILSQLREAFRALYEERLVMLILFGSQARGDAQMGLDIDVMVVLKDPVVVEYEIGQTSDILCALSLEHNIVVSSIFVDEKRYHTEKSPLLLNVRREGIRL